MGNARFIGRVGALAVALGIGAAAANTPGIALAGPDTTSSQADSPSPSSSPGTAASPQQGSALPTTTSDDSSEPSTGLSTELDDGGGAPVPGTGVDAAGATGTTVGSAATDGPRTRRAQRTGDAHIGLRGSSRVLLDRLSALVGDDILKAPRRAASYATDPSDAIDPSRSLSMRVSSQRDLSAPTEPTAPSAGLTQAPTEPPASLASVVTPEAATPPAPAAVSQPFAPRTVVSRVLGLFGLNVLDATAPAAPLHTSVLLGLFEWVRRQTGQTPSDVPSDTPVSEGVVQPTAAFASLAAVNTAPAAALALSAPVFSAPTSTTVGTNPKAVAVSATTAYVVNTGSNTVSAVNRASGQVTSIGVVRTPSAIALSADGRRAYVAGYSAVSVIDTTTNTVVKTVTTSGGQSNGIAVSPNGQRLYVTGSTRLAVIDMTATNPAVIARVRVGSIPLGVAVSPDGSRVYVTNVGSSSVSVLNAANNIVIRSITVGGGPAGVVVSPDNARVYVGNTSSNTISVLNPTATTPVVATIAVGARPDALAISPDGSTVYSANRPDTMSVIDTGTNTIIATASVDSAPENGSHGIAVSPDGTQIYVADAVDRALRILTINRTNAAPVAGTPAVASINESNGAVSGPLNFSDPDGDALSYSVVSQSTSGTATVTAAGTYTFIPTTAARNTAAQTTGPDSTTFSVRASDGTLSATVSVTVPISPLAVSNPPPSGDSTAALQAMFDQLKPGDTLTLSAQTYQHSGVLKIRVSGVTIDGNGATLQATNDATSAVQILADGVTVKNLTLSAPVTGPRYDTLNQHKLVVQANGVTVSNVTVDRSAGAGVFVFGASNFTLDRVTVKDTRADGIHMTNGANNGHVINPVTERTGDDGIAVVSYGNEPICHDIVIDSPTVRGTTWGRGISVVGGQSITYNNINVSQTNAAGVYIASEGSPYNTGSVNNIQILGGTVTGANTNPAIVHGAVLIYGGYAGRTISNVTISGLTISNTPTVQYWNVGVIVDAGSVSGLRFTNIALVNTTLTALSLTKVPAGTYTASGWTRNGQPITVP